MFASARLHLANGAPAERVVRNAAIFESEKFTRNTRNTRVSDRTTSPRGPARAKVLESAKITRSRNAPPTITIKRFTMPFALRPLVVRYSVAEIVVVWRPISRSYHIAIEICEISWLARNKSTHTRWSRRRVVELLKFSSRNLDPKGGKTLFRDIAA